MPLVPDPKNCDISVKRAIQLLSKKLGYTGTPVFASIALTNLIASRLVATGDSKILESIDDLSAWITGTANEIIVTSDGDGTITLSLSADQSWEGGSSDVTLDTLHLSVPQPLHTDDSPIFAGLTLDNTSLILTSTARVIKELELNAANIAAGASGVVIDTAQIPYIGYKFGVGDNMYAQFETPESWDESTDITFLIYWYIDEARDGDNQEVQWAIDWKACPPTGTESIVAPTHTGNIDFGDQLIPTVALYLTRTSRGTISSASLSHGDVIGLDINRVAIDTGNDPTAEPVLLRVEIEYTSNKLGEAT